VRRLLVLLAGLLALCIVSPALAVNEDCVSATSGLWSAAGTWTTCGASTPGAAAGQSATISSGHAVLYDVASLANSLQSDASPALVITGTLDFAQIVGTRDGDNFRTLTIKSDASTSTSEVTGTGRLVLGPGDRIAMDATTARVNWDMGTTFEFVGRGAVYPTVIDTITIAEDDATCGDGKKWTITVLDTGGATYRTKRRVRFDNGPARTASVETFTGTTDKTLALCADLADGSSAGHRLTPHANFNEYCTGAGTPIACCSGADAGTCRANAFAYTTARHPTPTLSGNSVCTAAGTPYLCCSGANAGVCIEQRPQVGDKISYIDDAWMYRSAGSAAEGWYMIYPGAGATTPPVLIAMNLSGVGNAVAGLLYHAGSDGQTCSISDSNVHDYNAAGVFFQGCANTVVERNVVHDAGADADEALCPICVGNDPGTGRNISTSLFTDNRFYRIMGNALEGSFPLITTPLTSITIRRNWVFDGCITLTGECNGIEYGTAETALAEDNVVYDISAGDATPSVGGFEWGVKAAGGYQTTRTHLVRRNWVVNVSGSGLSDYADRDEPNQMVLGNYVSHTRDIGIWTRGKVIGNVVLDYALMAGLNEAGIRNGIVVRGNFVGHHAGVTNSARSGIEPTQGVHPYDFLISDNIVSGIHGGTSVIGIGPDPVGGGFFLTDGNVVASHNTVDDNGITSVGLRWAGFVPTASKTLTMADNAVTHTSAGGATACSADADVVDNVDRTFRSTLPGIAGSAVGGGDCTTNTNETTAASGLRFKDRTNWNYAPASGSPLLGAGGTPVGSDVGARWFRFNFNTWSLWGDILPFPSPRPASFTNSGSIDTDGDGVIDGIDNCPGRVNPIQQDTDADGIGDPCDFI